MLLTKQKILYENLVEVKQLYLQRTWVQQTLDTWLVLINSSISHQPCDVLTFSSSIYAWFHKFLPDMHPACQVASPHLSMSLFDFLSSPAAPYRNSINPSKIINIMNFYKRYDVSDEMIYCCKCRQQMQYPEEQENIDSPGKVWRRMMSPARGSHRSSTRLT